MGVPTFTGWSTLLLNSCCSTYCRLGPQGKEHRCIHQIHSSGRRNGYHQPNSPANPFHKSRPKRRARMAPHAVAMCMRPLGARSALGKARTRTAARRRTCTLDEPHRPCNPTSLRGTEDPRSMEPLGPPRIDRHATRDNGCLRSRHDRRSGNACACHQHCNHAYPCCTQAPNNMASPVPRQRRTSLQRVEQPPLGR